MELNAVPAGKSLFESVLWAACAGNTRSSPSTGAAFPRQFAGVFHLASAPAPVHVREVAAKPVDSGTWVSAPATSTTTAAVVAHLLPCLRVSNPQAPPISPR